MRRTWRDQEKHAWIGTFLNFKSLQIEMGEVDAKRVRVTRYELRHDLHTVSLLTDYLVFSPKYRGKVLLGDVAEVAEENIRENCKELDNEVNDMAVNVDHENLLRKAFTKKSFVIRRSVPLAG
ncbi:REP element-mobilizing transposase RayT [Candidatus Methanophagaceae archaeon]|nr:REP element-mobilizing transposase RayT [Methanophagales archaeon]